MLLITLFLLYFSTSFTKCARILCVMPLPLYSHQTTFQPVWKELSLRGHQVTTIVSYGINDENLTNLTEIVIKESFGALERHNFLGRHAQKGVMGFMEELGELVEDLYDVQFGDYRVKKLMTDPTVKFDLVIFEAATFPFVYSWRFKCPMIGLMSMLVSFQYSYNMGNPNHPLETPAFLLKVDVNNMSLMEKITSIFLYLFGVFTKDSSLNVYDKINKEHFGDGIPKTSELIKNIDMLFMVNNPVINELRPVYPNTINLGALHLQPEKELPNYLKTFLDNSKVPVVYFSLGSNVNSNLLNQTIKNEIFNAFKEMPYKFLVKCDWGNITIPSNVKISKWYPQQDVLRHKNVKLFITQGGLQSLQEAIAYEVPLIGIPFFADQHQNVYKIVERGIGVNILYPEITKGTLKNAINEVLSKSKYKQNIEKLKTLMDDEPITSLEKALFWIEYVIRHKGAPLFKLKTANMPLYQYLMLDILGIILACLIISIFCFYKIVKLLKFVFFGNNVNFKLKKTN